MFAAAKHGRVEMVELLIKWGFSYRVRSENNESPLSIAVKNNYLPIVEVLLRHDATLPRSEAQPLLCYASRNGNVRMVRVLLRGGCSSLSLTRRNFSPLDYCANGAVAREILGTCCVLSSISFSIGVASNLFFLVLLVLPLLSWLYSR